MFENIESIPHSLHTNRKNAGIGCIFQFISAVSGLFVYLLLRRLPMILIINLFTFGVSIIGYFGAQRLNKTQISIHGFSTTVILGGFFLYQIIEILFIHNSDKWLLFLLSLPYLVDFTAGCLSLSLYFKIIDEGMIAEIPEAYQEPLIDNNSNFCKICYERPCSMVVYPCGHKCLCAPCSRNLVKSLSKCPFCRATIRDMILVFE